MRGALTSYIQTSRNSLSDALHGILARLLQKQVTARHRSGRMVWHEMRKQMLPGIPTVRFRKHLACDPRVSKEHSQHLRKRRGFFYGEGRGRVSGPTFQRVRRAASVAPRFPGARRPHGRIGAGRGGGCYGRWKRSTGSSYDSSCTDLTLEPPTNFFLQPVRLPNASGPLLFEG
jgi:hypothetical protein